MIKRILVALDPDQDTPAATRYATDIAARTDARVSGLATIDTGAIAAQIGPGGAVGAAHYAEISRSHMIEEARSTARELVERFDSALEFAHLPHEKRVAEGTPFEQVIEETKYNDLLVIGRVPHFFYNRPDQETNTLARIVKQGLSPTLVVGEEYHPVKRVIIAYDGSAPSARTMHRFAQLRPFGTNVSVEIVNVRSGDSASKRRESELLLRLAGDYLREHGFDNVMVTSLVGDSPGTLLINHAQKSGVDLIVAGAHAVSAARRIAFGSTTHTLRKECTVPLFLFH